ncbi:MAG: FkbM family methyltransferase [Saprospiraceae bacterium]
MGANKGEFFIQTKKTYQSRFYLVEPNQSLFDTLNVSQPDRKFKVVIAPENKLYSFYNSKNDEAGSLNPSMAAQWQLGEMEQVQGWTFNYFIKEANIGEIDLIKIDIEGEELSLLRNLSVSKLSSIKQISCEFHDFMDKSQLNQVLEIILFLKRNNYLVLNFSNKDHRDVLFVNAKACSFFYRIIMSAFGYILNIRRFII